MATPCHISYISNVPDKVDAIAISFAIGEVVAKVSTIDGNGLTRFLQDSNVFPDNLTEPKAGVITFFEEIGCETIMYPTTHIIIPPGLESLANHEFPTRQ
jgi:hypothetical protein